MLAIVIFSLSLSLTLAQSWNAANDPFKIDPNMNTYLTQLPLAGKLKDQRLGWPGNHWSNYLGGITHRWSAAYPQNFSYKLLSLNALKKLPPHEFDELSPAEKFDIFNSDYHYPTVKKIWAQLSPRESQWHGICHGYAPAALNHPEPDRVVVKNREGLSITFYSSDVAALMSYYYAKVIITPVSLIGRRCNFYSTSQIPSQSRQACADMNAGSFHVVMGNRLGLEGRGFVADIDRYFEVWNHIAVDYTSVIRAELEPDKNSAETTVKRVQVESVVTYAAAIAPKFDPVIGTEAAEYAQNTYEYYLDLDKSGYIIGGEWIGQNRPDFLWIQKKAIFNGEWSALNQIYRPAVISQD